MIVKNTTYITLLFLILLAIVYFMAADTLIIDQSGDSMGAGYFPKMLSVLLIILCLINIFQTRKKKHERIDLPNLRVILVTIGFTILYFICWGLFGFFYLFTFLYLFILFNYYNRSKKALFLHAGISLTFILFLYFVFDVFLSIRF